MALTPEGTPYVESSDLVANYPAASLALANRVDLVGVLPFATSAARATAIPSPTDGQYTYLQDTNTTQFWNGSAWQTAGLTPGLNLVTPTSIANTGGSSALSGGQVTFTGVTAISLNGVFSATYDNYRIFFTATASTTANATMRLRVGGVDASAGAYGQAGYYAYMDAVGSGFVSNGGVASTSWPQTTAMSTLSQSGFIMDIQNPARAVSTFGVHHSNAVDANYLFAPRGVRHTTATAYDGFTSTASAGNMTGILRCYGYQNS